MRINRLKKKTHTHPKAILMTGQSISLATFVTAPEKRSSPVSVWRSAPTANN